MYPVGLLVVLFLYLGFAESFRAGFQRLSSRFDATRLRAKKFDPENILEISATKPLGITLVENEEGGDLGVCIDEINEGSIQATGKAYKGLYLLTVNGQDVRNALFDDVMDAIIEAPAESPVDLTFIDPRYVMKGPATLTVVMPDGGELEVPALKGQNLRTVLSDAQLPIYAGSAKMSNCGGAGTCGTCAVLVTQNEFWEKRPSFEGKRLKKYSENARLSCNTIIEGDCRVALQPVKLDG
mmetsp:Transcript_2979/g.5081  ORF Transcript_2979/g.5081 Transcript_2979/m.5081 type:complete len:240 (+) Transcript_2979:49-768(+)